MKSILILGGGYGGLSCARALDSSLDETWSITLVDRGNDHALVTRLPEVLAGTLPPARASVPFAEILPKRVRRVVAVVRGVDFQTRSAQTDVGTLGGDWLVVALGSVSDYLHIPGARKYSYTFKSVADAVRLRSALLDRPHIRRIAVVGAGYTGTEVSGELATWAPSPFDVTVVADSPGLLPDGNQRVARAAERILRRQGAALALGDGVTEVAADHVLLSSSTRVPADLVVWAAHTRSALAPARGLIPVSDSRPAVDPYLRAIGHDRVFLIGDVASIHDFERDRSVPWSAQAAVEEGTVAARNLVAESRGKQPTEFQAQLIGEALSLGQRAGVAEVGGVLVTGPAAVATKRAAIARYLYRLGGVRLVRKYL